MLNKVCSFLSTILVICLLILAALLWGPKLLGYQGYAVISGSMEPNIHVGAVVYDKPVEFNEIEVGDVITYTISGETQVTHRVIEIDSEAMTVTTQGDANDTADANPVNASQIVGIVALNIPYLGYISIYARTPLAITAVCAVLILILLLNFLPEIFKKEEPAKSERPVDEEHKRED